MSEIKKMTEDEIKEWCNANYGYMSVGMLISFARHCGILKDKVNRWKWTNGVVTINKPMTHLELCSNIDLSYKFFKVEGTEEESDE